MAGDGILHILRTLSEIASPHGKIKNKDAMNNKNLNNCYCSSTNKYGGEYG